MEPIRRVASRHRLPYTIANCTALQVIAETEAPLSKGDLTLQLPTKTSSLSSSTDDNKPPILLARVGTTLFPLFSDTVFGTFVKKPKQYGFEFKLSKTAVTQVRLVLPDDVSQAVQDEFEEILIELGLLFKGIRAAGDEIMRGAREGGLVNAEKIKSGTRDHIESTPGAGNDPLTFSKGVHDNVASFNSGTDTAYQYALSASNAVAKAAGTAGAEIKKRVAGLSQSSTPPRQSSESKADDMSDMRKALNEAASGVAEGASNVSTTAQDSASKAISHNYGDEADGLASSVGDGMKNMSKTAGNAIHSTSVIGTTGYAVEGAVNEDSKEKNTGS